MSKVFSKRSGFTLVEIIVAFAIFAIMAAMLVSLTGLAVKQRQSNLNLSRELSDQQAYLAAHERETDMSKTDTTDPNRKMEFNFEGSSSASLKYGVAYAADAGETVEAGISYFVSEAKYDPDKIKNDGDKDDEGEGTGLGLTEKVDSRIYGSKDFEYIQLSDIKEVADPEIQAAGNSMFTFDVYANDNETAVKNKDARLARNYKMRFDKKVIDCGYVGGTGGSPVYISYRNASFGSDGRVSGLANNGMVTNGGNNQFEILPCSEDTVRVSIPQSVVKSNYSETNNDVLSNYCFPGMRSHFYVVLEGDVDLTADSFGKYAVNAYGEFVFTPVEVVFTDKDGNAEDPVKFINVYGALPKNGATILEPELPTE